MVPTSTVSLPTAPNAAKSMLARLLATENISVLHQNIPTAFFDLKTRSLHLPMWSNASGSLYDMLVGHEVAHALYTPADGWKSAIDSVSAATGCAKHTAKQYLNIVEDARIERMIQSKFRGLKADFISAYKTLMEREFFGDLSNISEMILADRFNLHFKCGVHAGVLVKFSAEESAFVARGETVATWGDVVALATDMIVWAQEQSAQDEQDEQEQTQPVAGESQDEGGEAEVDASGSEDGSEESDESGSNAGGGEGNERESADESDDGSEAGDKPTDSDPQGEAQSAGVTGKPQPSNTKRDPIAPSTNQSLEKALEEFAKADSGSIDEIVRVTTANLSQSAKTVDYTQFLADMRGSSMSRYMGTPVRIGDYTTASTTMATAFNRRKAADNWRRTTVAKSGSLDTLRMNQYKWTDDIFRRTTRIADGKNHGIVILLDWSASMNHIMQSTIGQLFILSDFCRKCGVPFEVYAFSDCGYYSTKDSYSDAGKKEREAAYDADYKRRKDSSVHTRDVTMFNLLSSRMNSADYEAAKTCLWNWRQMGSCDLRYSLNGTPTTAALMAAADLVEAFIKRSRVQIAHTVVLTDGEPTDTMEFNWDKSGTRYSNRTAVVLTDHRTGAAYDLNRVTKWTKDEHGYRKHGGYFNFGTNGIPNTVSNPHAMIAVDIVRRRTGAKMHWIGLVGNTRRAIDPTRWGMVCKTNEWKRDGFVRGDVWGWDSAIIVDADRFQRDGNGEISINAQNALDKAESKMDNATTKNALAKAFMESQMAHGALRTVATHIGEYLAV